jgi:hypothetical protein
MASSHSWEQEVLEMDRAARTSSMMLGDPFPVPDLPRWLIQVIAKDRIAWMRAQMGIDPETFVQFYQEKDGTDTPALEDGEAIPPLGADDFDDTANGDAATSVGIDPVEGFEPALAAAVGGGPLGDVGFEPGDGHVVPAALPPGTALREANGREGDLVSMPDFLFNFTNVRTKEPGSAWGNNVSGETRPMLVPIGDS